MPRVQGARRPRQEPVRPQPPSGLSEFSRGPWFPVVCVLIVVLVIVLLFSSHTTDLVAVLSALAAVVTALGGLILAAGRFHRHR
jgi:hypothetical protein